MTNSQYNVCLTVFFITYSLIEPMTNVLLKKLRPNIFLPTTILLWGIVMTTVRLSRKI
jgi:sugar phosphate permease